MATIENQGSPSIASKSVPLSPCNFKPKVTVAKARAGLRESREYCNCDGVPSTRISTSPFVFQMLPRLFAVLCAALPVVLSQSNYASQGNSIEYQPGLPPSTVLNGKVTKLDDISSMIFLNRTKAYLNCSQGSMQVELKFEEPFYGVAYADFDRNSACIFKGRGLTSAKLELPLKGARSLLC